MADNWATVTVRFWAGAKRAAGHEVEQLDAMTIGQVRAILADRPALRELSTVASFLVDGVQVADTALLHDGAQVDVLPPFAGGAPLIVGIGGSPRAESVTNVVLEQCLSMLRERGARTQSITGTELVGLPIYGSDTPSSVRASLVDAARRADCLVIASPGYHGGMSGLVKNALDHLEELRSDREPYLDGRAVGVIVTAAGWQACGTTLESVRSTVHALRGWPTPIGVTMNSAVSSGLRKNFGAVRDPGVMGALEILADQLMRFASWREHDSLRHSTTAER